MPSGLFPLNTESAQRRQRVQWRAVNAAVVGPHAGTAGAVDQARWADVAKRVDADEARPMLVRVFKLGREVENLSSRHAALVDQEHAVRARGEREVDVLASLDAVDAVDDGEKNAGSTEEVEDTVHDGLLMLMVDRLVARSRAVGRDRIRGLIASSGGDRSGSGT